MNKCEILKEQRDILARKLMARHTHLGKDGFECCGNIIELPYDKRFDRPSCLDCESNGGCTAVKGKILYICDDFDRENGHVIFVKGDFND